MNIEEVIRLPDSMPAVEIYELFERAINDFEQNKLDKPTFFDILYELTDRQGYTYEVLANPLREELDDLICGLWNTRDYDEVDIMLVFIVNLALVKSFACVKKSIEIKNNIDSKILEEIQDTIAEVGDNISNPYYDLEKLKKVVDKDSDEMVKWAMNEDLRNWRK